MSDLGKAPEQPGLREQRTMDIVAPRAAEWVITFAVTGGVFGVGRLAARLDELLASGRIGAWHIGPWVDCQRSAGNRRTILRQTASRVCRGREQRSMADHKALVKEVVFFRAGFGERGFPMGDPIHLVQGSDQLKYKAATVRVEKASRRMNERFPVFEAR